MDYIGNCKKCKKGRRVSYPHRNAAGRSYRPGPGGEELYPRSYQWDGKKYVGDCVCDCGRFFDTWKPIEGVVVENVRCDSRCIYARGHTCNCSCGGKNHGAGWMLGTDQEKEDGNVRDKARA